MSLSPSSIRIPTSFPFSPPLRHLPRPGNTELIELLSGTLNSRIALAYGRHIVGGNLVFEHENDDDSITRFVALGQGEWDGIETLWVNGLVVDHTDTAKYHFHPGLEGELGVESDPATRNQKICSFLASNFSPQLTFSRSAYLALKLAPDPAAPSEEFVVRGIYRTLRVRIFDAAGTQTSYAYSANPAWVALDLYIRRFLKPHGLVNEALTAAEKDRIDFAAFRDWADWADETVNGQKRWEANIAFLQQTDLLRAMEWVMFLSRVFPTWKGAKLSPQRDQVRTALLTAGQDDFAAGGPGFSQKKLRDLANRFVLRYRDLASGKGPGTISTTGTAVTGVGTDFTKRFKKNMALKLESGPQAGELRIVAAKPASDTSMTLVTAFSADQSAVEYSNPSGDFQVGERILEEEEHQDQVKRVISAEFDLGNNLLERLERVGETLRRRTHELKLQLWGRLLGGLDGMNDLLPGDVITAPDTQELDTTRDFEVLEISDEVDGSRELLAQEFMDVFQDPPFVLRLPPPLPGPPKPHDPPTAPSDDVPALGSWVSFDGALGLFFGVIAPSASIPTQEQALLLTEVELASDSGFTANVTTQSLGQGQKFFIVELPNVSRFARFRQKFPLTDFNDWVTFGSPTSKLSGHPIDEGAVGGSFNPSAPNLDPAKHGPGTFPFGAILFNPDQFASFFGSKFGLSLLKRLMVDFANTDFEQGGTSPLDADSGWKKIFGTDGNFTYETTSPLAGSRSLRIQNDSAVDQRIDNRIELVTRPGEKFYIQATGKMTVGGGPSGRVNLSFFDKNNSPVGAINLDFSSTTQQTLNTSGTVPATAVKGVLIARAFANATSSAFLADEIVVRKGLPDALPLEGRVPGLATLLQKLTDLGLLKDPDQFESFFGTKFGLSLLKRPGIDFENADFEQGGSDPLGADSGWKLRSGDGTVSYETASPIAGSRSLKITDTAGTATIVQNQKILTVVPGQKFTFRFKARVSASGVQGFASLHILDANGGFVDNIGGFITDTAEQTYVFTKEIAAGGAQAQILLRYHQNSTVAGDVIYDQVEVFQGLPSPDQFESFFGSIFALKHIRQLEVAFANTDFEQGGSDPLGADSGWELDSGTAGNFTYETTSPVAGLRSLRIQNDSAALQVAKNKVLVTIKPGEKLYLQSAGKPTVALGNVNGAQIRWLDKNGAAISAFNTNHQTTGVTTSTVTGTAPAGTVAAELRVFTQANATSSALIIDEIVVRKGLPDGLPIEGHSTVSAIAFTDEGNTFTVDQTIETSAVGGTKVLISNTAIGGRKFSWISKP